MTQFLHGLLTMLISVYMSPAGDHAEGKRNVRQRRVIQIKEEIGLNPQVHPIQIVYQGEAGILDALGGVAHWIFEIDFRVIPKVVHKMA